MGSGGKGAGDFFLSTQLKYWNGNTEYMVLPPVIPALGRLRLDHRGFEAS